jgi:hypothetical protein
VNRKCRGNSANSYPGISISSEVQVADKKSCRVTTTPALQVVGVTNASLLTYEVSFQSTCDKDHLRYISAGCSAGASADDDNVWSGTFSAPFRWKGTPRPASAQSHVAARAGKYAIDRDIAIAVDCSCEPHSAIGTFQVLLQVEADGR